MDRIGQSFVVLLRAPQSAEAHTRNIARAPYCDGWSSNMLPKYGVERGQGVGATREHGTNFQGPSFT